MNTTERLNLIIDGKPMNVPRFRYVTAKLKQLQEFGYPDLTAEEVDVQITNILKGQPLDVIGKFMENEVVK